MDHANERAAVGRLGAVVVVIVVVVVGIGAVVVIIVVVTLVVVIVVVGIHAVVVHGVRVLRSGRVVGVEAAGGRQRKSGEQPKKCAIHRVRLHGFVSLWPPVPGVESSLRAFAEGCTQNLTQKLQVYDLVCLITVGSCVDSAPSTRA